MKYIVKTQGKIYTYKHKAYSIEAESPEEAERIAYEKFNKEFAVVDNDLKVAGSSVKYRTYIALAALAISVVLALIGFKSPQMLGAQTIRPDLKSCLYGVIIYLLLIFKIKGITNSFRNITDIILAVLMSLAIGSLLQLLVAKMPFAGFFDLIHLDIRIAVLALAVIAWLGSGILSLICAAIFVGLISYSVSHLGPVLMNFMGILYLVCTAVGIVAYLSSLPALYQGFMDLKAKFVKN